MGELENGRVGEWENRRMGELENGRVGEWENGRVGESENRGIRKYVSVRLPWFPWACRRELVVGRIAFR